MPAQAEAGVLGGEVAVQSVECRESLRYFTRQAWPLVEPGTPFKSSWHIDAIAETLEAIIRVERAG